MPKRCNASGEYPVVAAVDDDTSTDARYTVFVHAAKASSPGLRYVGIAESPNDNASPPDRAAPYKKFRVYTRSWVTAPTAQGDRPAAWVVEKYVAGVAPGMSNDRTPDSVLGVALYLAQNFLSGQPPTVR